MQKYKRNYMKMMINNTTFNKRYKLHNKSLNCGLTVFFFRLPHVKLLIEIRNQSSTCNHNTAAATCDEVYNLNLDTIMIHGYASFLLENHFTGTETKIISQFDFLL